MNAPFRDLLATQRVERKGMLAYPYLFSNVCNNRYFLYHSELYEVKIYYAASVVVLRVAASVIRESIKQYKTSLSGFYFSIYL